MMSSADTIRKMMEQVEAGGMPPDPPHDPPLSPPYGGGTPGGMEARVAKLEAHMEHVREDLAKLQGLPVEVAKLQERVASLPTKGFIVFATSGALGLVAAISAYVQWVLSAHSH